MEIVGIEKEFFNSFKKKLERIALLVPKQPSNNTLFIEQEWIEGKDLAASLNLPPRRLQHLQESGKLSFPTIGKKIYYRISEVKLLLEQGKINSK
jgi:hypothetical protein